MPSQQIPLIMEIIDNIVLPDDRKRKYTGKQILKIFNISEWLVLKKYLVSKLFQGEPE